MAIINLWPCPGIVAPVVIVVIVVIVAIVVRVVRVAIVISNCTLLAGFRVLLVKLLLVT